MIALMIAMFGSFGYILLSKLSSSKCISGDIKVEQKVSKFYYQDNKIIIQSKNEDNKKEIIFVDPCSLKEINRISVSN